MWRSVSQCDVLCRIVTCGACHVVMKAACTSRAVLLRADLRSLWIHHAFCTPSGYIMRSALPLDTSCVHHTSCRVLFCCMRTCAPSGYIMRLCDCVSRFVCAQMIGESCYVSTVVECAVFAQHLCRATPPFALVHAGLSNAAYMCVVCGTAVQASCTGTSSRASSPTLELFSAAASSSLVTTVAGSMLCSLRRGRWFGRHLSALPGD